MTGHHDISDLRFLDNTTASWLRDAGIATIDQLKKLGAVRAYMTLKKSGHFPKLQVLWIMYGALRNLPATALSSNEKHMLIRELANNDPTVRIQ